MMVYINSPAIEDFNPQPSINEWLNSKSRRISKEDTVSEKVASDSSEESDVESVCSSDSNEECEPIFE